MYTPQTWQPGVAGGTLISSVKLNQMEAGIAAAIPPWTPNTNFPAGFQVISPNNDVVSAIAAHTSGTVFNPANWALSATFTQNPAAPVAWLPSVAVAPGNLRTLPDGTTAIRSAGSPTTTQGVFNDTESALWVRTQKANAASRSLDVVRDNFAHGDSVVLHGYGDSTIAGSTGVTKTWLRQLADKLAARYANYRVRYFAFNASTTDFDRTVVKASPTTDRRVILPGTAGQGMTARTSASDAISTEFTLEVDLAATNYASGANQTIAGQFGTSGSYGWLVFIGVGGLLNIIYSTTGSNQGAITATASLTTVVANGARVKIKVIFSGSGASTTGAFYTSVDDGVTYTQLGATVTAGAFSSTIFPTNRQVEIGAYNNGNTWPLTASVYELKLRSGINTTGQIVMPTLPDQWSAWSTSTHTFAGSPTVDIYGGAAGGYSVATLYQYRTIMCPPVGQQAILVDCIINQGFDMDPYAWTSWTQLASYMKATCPSAGLSLVIPNPERQTGGVTQTTQDTLRRRAALLKGFAQQNSLDLFDVQAIFLSATDYTTYMQDDRHPNDAGHGLWAGYIDRLIAS